MPLETSPATHERTYHGPETRDRLTFNMISMCVPTTALQAYQRQNGKLNSLQRKYSTTHGLVERRPDLWSAP
eukprot:4154199-Pleurochrysis_carterae.AAC.1